MRTHGYKGTDVYRLWGQIVTRCENPNAKSYRNGKQKYIGAYRTLADAVKARDIAEGSIHDGEGGQREEG